MLHDYSESQEKLVYVLPRDQEIFSEKFDRVGIYLLLLYGTFYNHGIIFFWVIVIGYGE